MYDVHTEKSAIATALYNSQALELLMECDEDIFHNLNIKSMFKVMKELHSGGHVVDLLSLRQGLIEHGIYEKVGGSSIVDLANTYTTYNIQQVIRTLTKYQQRRKLQNLSMLIDEKVKAPGVEVEDIFNQINETMQALDSINNAEYVEIKNILKDDPVNDFNITGKYIETGFHALDSILIGLFKSELAILAARPGCGKTALALNIAANVARTKNVLFVSLEMSNSQLGLRLLSADAQVNSDFIRRGKLLEDDYARLKQSANKVRQLKLSMVDAQSLDSIIAQIRKLARRIDLSLVVIDYLQLIQVSTNAQRYIQVGEISRRLKLLTRELDIPILCCAQIGRPAEERVPKLSDLRESGDIEQDADVVMFIHKDPALKKGKVVNILFAKNRSGMADTKTEMVFDKACTKFYDVTYREDI